MCLINAAHKHFGTQTCKKSKTALKDFMGAGVEVPRIKSRLMGPRVKGRGKQIPENRSLGDGIISVFYINKRCENNKLVKIIFSLDLKLLLFSYIQ